MNLSHISSSIASGISVSKKTLGESIDVLDRRINDGEKPEKKSIVTADDIISRGANGSSDFKTIDGMQVKTFFVEIPRWSGNTSIHSHETAIANLPDGCVSYSDARVLGPNDPAIFFSFSTNIIVGNLGAPTVSNDMIKGQTIISPGQGAVIYNSRGVAIQELTRKAIQKILK